MRRLFLLSNSRDAEGRYLVHPREALAEHLRGVRHMTFVPYAGVGSIAGWDAYAAMVREAFVPLGIAIRSVHESADPAEAIRSSDAIAVGGGNTFHLLATLQRTKLLGALRERAEAGVPYVGWSAGSAIACATIGTTNDMPIVQPASFDALGLVRFQINAHFTDAHPPGFQGETRRQRLAEYLAVNGGSVIGLPEGDWLEVNGPSVVLRGAHAAPVFRADDREMVAQPGDEIQDILER